MFQSIRSECACNFKLSIFALQGKNVVVTYVKYGKHEMDDTEEDHKRIYVAIQVLALSAVVLPRMECHTSWQNLRTGILDLTVPPSTRRLLVGSISSS